VPIYEYQCESCQDKFEIKQSMKDDSLTVCPRCGKRVQRLISSPAIMFKGSGWYVTDYSDKMKPSAGSEVQVPATGEKGEKGDKGDKKDTAPSTSDQTTSPVPAAPAAPPSSVPASTSSSTNSSTATTTPSPSTTK
jgi:putative FmdB family regulatory protein